MANSTLLETPESPPDDSSKHGKLGPSDTSDSGSDLAGLPDDEALTDSGGTGERVSVNPDEEERTGSDVLPDEVVDEERLARSRPGDDEDDATPRR
ncbi:MAG: MatE family transporter [Pigmentiphaga sp.]|uniref:MatE family transporter n=1 Tax=Pigmentiphaga sp. TaxID=1977564 RepID=UPI0029A6A6BB|nr:MatE family transporter [Pigmentiphaga sp.]MDX3907260.1 MatE family transporter [Pigmentiphaga sp.]